MSGLHFGFYKVTAKDDVLAKLVTQLINIPFRTGFSPWRARGDLNVSLQKKKGCYDPEKQRTIHLLEADFSEGCKTIFSHRMMSNALRNNQIPEEQYAHKGGKSIDAALHKVLILDQMRLLRRPGVGFASDLMNCYDRMVHAAGGLSMRSLGVPANAIKCLSSTVQGMRNYVRTAYGDSTHYYGGDMNDPLQGGGQGNPAAPPMWTALTITILKILSTYEPGITMMTSISLTLIVLSAIMYVDDTDMFIFAKPDEQVEEVLDRAQTLANRWTQALWATGGALRPEKCWWYLVDFKWVGSKWKYVTIEESNGRITVPNHEEVDTAVERVEFDKPMRTLGVRIAADGNMSGEKEYLIEKSREWSQQINKAYLYKSEALLALTSTISRTWLYPLQATTLSQNDCDDIMKPVYKTILPKMGINRNVPLVYRYAPRYLNGLECPNVYTMQGCAQIKSIIDHINSGSKLGHTMIAQLEAVSLELGTGRHLFELHFPTWSKLLTHCWFKQVWKFCFENNISLRGKYNRPTLVRSRDFFLMERVMKNMNLFRNIEEVMSINRCRLYLQVATISDITSVDGRYITEHAWKGERDPDRESRWIWPTQARPTKKEWAIWRSCIHLVWQVNEDNSTDGIPLGLWTGQCHQKYRWFIQKNMKNIFHQMGHKTLKYSLMTEDTQLRNCRRYGYPVTVHNIPKDVTITTVVKRTSDDTVKSHGCARKIGRTQEPDSSRQKSWWETAVETKSNGIREMLTLTKIIGEGKELAHAIMTGDGKMVSDGSFDPNTKMGTCAYRIENCDRRTLAQGVCKVPGDCDDVNSYRAELTGIFLMMVIVEMTCTHFEITEGLMTLACDSKSGLDTSMNNLLRPSCKWKHYDLLHEIFEKKTAIPIEIKTTHVKGHQSEDERKGCQLSEINHDMDLLAKGYLNHCKAYPLNISNELSNDNWTVWLDNKKIIKNIDKHITDWIHGKKLKQYWVKKGRFSQQILDIIDWTALEDSVKQRTHADAVWATKLDSHFIPVGERLHLIGEWDNPSCKVCGNSKESIGHLFNCTHERARKYNREALVSLTAWFTISDTNPIISSIILRWLLSDWNIPMQNFAHLTDEVDIRTAIRHQDQIGRLDSLAGKWSILWRQAQQSYGRKSGNKHYSGRRWSASFNQQIRHYCKSVWKERCAIIHENDYMNAQVKLAAELKSRVQEEFHIGVNGLRHSEKHLISGTSMIDVMKKKLPDQQRWINHVVTSRRRYKNFFSNHMESMRRNMKLWLNGDVYSYRDGRKCRIKFITKFVELKPSTAKI